MVALASGPGSTLAPNPSHRNPSLAEPAGQAPTPGVAATDHIEVWLIDPDDADANPHLDHVLHQGATTVPSWVPRLHRPGALRAGPVPHSRSRSTTGHANPRTHRRSVPRAHRQGPARRPAQQDLPRSPRPAMGW